MYPLIVIDINVMASGATLSQSPPSQVMQLWKKGDIDIAISPALLQKIERVFNYPRVQELTGWNDADVQDFIADIRGTAVVTAGITQVDVTTDPEDNHIFATVSALVDNCPDNNHNIIYKYD